MGRVAAWYIQDPEKRARELGIPDQDFGDLLHDAFILTLERMEDVRPEILAAWFRGVLRKKKLHYIRAKAIAKKLDPSLAADIEDLPSPFPAPDADLARRQAIAAVFWLIEQVDECRREVAERHVLDGEPLPRMALSTREPIGTVCAKWESAKDDMRAAIERERKKQGTARWVVMLAALIELWLWFVVSGRYLRDAGAALGERAAGGPPGARREGQKSAERAGRRRSRVGALIACALVPLALMAHEAIRPTAIHAPAFAAFGPSVVRSLALARRRPLVAHGEERATPGGAPSADTPARSADAGQAREKGPVGPPRAKARPAASARKAPPVKPLTNAEMDMARHLLVVATTSSQAGRFAIAEAALKQYRRMFPENPYPEIYTRTAKAQRSR